MRRYYRWDPEKGEFVPGRDEPSCEGVCPVYQLASDRDKSAILDFEAEYERSETQSFLRATGFEDFRTGLWSIDLNKTDNSAIVLALVHNKVVGELSMSHYANTAENVKVGVIRGFCVLRKCRHAGIGRALFEFAKRQFEEWDVHRIELMYGLRNLADEEFCKRLGFEVPRPGQAIYRLK